MATESLTQVNQKLAYCRALLRQLRDDGEPDTGDRRLRHQALLDAAAFHLLCAHRHYLRELAEHCGVADSRPIAVEADLVAVLERQGKNAAEARELQALREDPESWLSALQGAYNACWERPEAPVHRIEVVDLDAPDGRPGAVTLERLSGWYRAFTALVERQRETSAEY